jgi:hypothetical protein
VDTVGAGDCLWGRVHGRQRERDAVGRVHSICKCCRSTGDAGP